MVYYIFFQKIKNKKNGKIKNDVNLLKGY